MSEQDEKVREILKPLRDYLHERCVQREADLERQLKASEDTAVRNKWMAEEMEAKLAEAQALNVFFRDSIGECHVMISRNDSEYQVRREWDPSDLPPRLQAVMRDRDALRATLEQAREMEKELFDACYEGPCTICKGTGTKVVVFADMEVLPGRIVEAIREIQQNCPACGGTGFGPLKSLAITNYETGMNILAALNVGKP